MQESEVKLLECPMCGSEAELFHDDCWYRAGCTKCGIGTGNRNQDYKAASQWNQRTPDTTKLVEALEAIKKHQELNVLGNARLSTTWQIANRALESYKGGK